MGEGVLRSGVGGRGAGEEGDVSGALPIVRRQGWLPFRHHATPLTPST